MKRAKKIKGCEDIYVMQDSALFGLLWLNTLDYMGESIYLTKEDCEHLKIETVA
jgi:hypothetical protein